MARGNGATGVYLILNLLNDKVYVGSTGESLSRRIRDHAKSLREGTHGNRHLQRAWTKYGPSAFRFRIVQRCPPSECLIYEQEWMDRLKAADHRYGYNICPRAGSVRGIVHSAESRVRHSKRAKLQFSTEEGRAKASAAANKRWEDPAEREKMAAKIRGYKHSPETCLKNSRTSKKRFEDPAERLKVAERMKRLWANPEFRAKMVTAQRLRKGRSA